MAGRPIDEKIVVMKLDNSDFTKKAADTSTRLGRLREALNRIPGVNLGKTAQEMGQIQNATDNVRMSRLATAVQGVSNQFSALRVMATTALATVTSMATQSGIAMANSLTLEPVMSGFREYETKIGAIGTMLSNTEWDGTDLDDVKATLGELNEYADQTIYSFEDMTTNIGRFTAAGVTLDDSAVAIKGLGNLAAVSGSNVEQLGSAMYQSSQALASGKLNLEDWNSLVNAGMAGKKTQDALVETAKAMGKNVDLTDGFRNSIQQGWLTSEVFLETLRKFGEDDSMTKAATSVRTFSMFMDSLKESIGSGWAQTWEIIFGDFEEATEFWTKMSNSVGDWFAKSTKARNEFIQGFKDGGGVENIFEGIANAAKALGDVFGAIGDGFERVFPPMSMDRIIGMTESFKNFTKGLLDNEEAMGHITTISEGFFSVIDSIITIAKLLGGALLKLIPPGAGTSILGFIANIAEMAISFNESLEAGNILTEGIQVLGTVFGGIGKVLGGALSGLSMFGDAVAEVWNILVNNDFTGQGPWAEDSIIVDWLFNIRDAFKEVGDWFKNTFEGFGVEDALSLGTIAGIFALIKKFTGGGGGIFETFNNIADSFNETLENVGDAVQNFSAGIKITNLLLIATALGILAVSLKTMSGIDAADLAKGITTLATALGVMIGGMVVISKFNITGGMRVSVTLIALAAAVNIMADALEQLSSLSLGELAKGIGGLVGVVTALSIAIIAMSKFGGKISASSLQLIALAGAIKILADAVEVMSGINTEGLVKGVVTLGLIFAQLAIFLKVVDGTKLGPGSAIGLIGVAGAVQMMVSAIQQISGIDVEGLVKGLSTIAIILAEIAIFSRVAGGPTLIAAGIGMVGIAAAINMLVPPIQTFSQMSWTELVKGLGAMAVALAAVAAAAIVASGSIGGAAAILLMATAMNMLAVPIERLGNMTWMDMLQGIIGLAGGLTVIAAAALLLSPATVPLLAFGAGLTLFGAAIALVGAGVALFGTGLATLATLTATSVAAIIGALGLLLKGFTELIPGAVNFVVELGLALVDGLVKLIPGVANGIAQLVLALIDTLNEHLPSFITKGTELVTNLLDGMGTAIPTLITAGIQYMTDLMNGMAEGIANNGPQLVNAMMGLMGEMLIVIIQAGASMISALLGWIPGVNEAAAEIGANATQYVRDNFKAADLGTEKGQEFANGLGGTSGDAGTAGKKVGAAGEQGVDSVMFNGAGSGAGGEYVAALGGTAGAARTAGTGVGNAGKTGAGSVMFNGTGSNAGQQFASGLGNKSGSARTAGSGVGNAGKSGAGSVMYGNTGSTAGSQFANGLSNKSGSARSSGKNIANSGKSGAGSVTMGSTGTNFGLGFANGINSRSVVTSVASAAVSIARKAKDTVAGWLDMHSPSRLMKKDGGFFTEGFAIGIRDKAKMVGDSAKGVAKTAVQSLNNFLDSFAVPKEDNELKFKAVVDYDQLDSSKFGTLKPFAIQPDTSLTSGLVTATKVESRQNGDNSPTGDVDNSKSEVHNHYAIAVEDKGYKSRGEIRKLAEQIQTEIKNIDDRNRMSKGEGVAF